MKTPQVPPLPGMTPLGISEDTAHPRSFWISGPTMNDGDVYRAMAENPAPEPGHTRWLNAVRKLVDEAPADTPAVWLIAGLRSTADDIAQHIIPQELDREATAEDVADAIIEGGRVLPLGRATP